MGGGKGFGRLLLSQQVADGGYGVLGNHTRAGVTHDGANLLPLLWLVAMVRTLFAGHLCFHLATALGAQQCVVVQLLALWAERFAAISGFGAQVGRMVAGAVHRGHLRDGAFFAFAALRHVWGVG